jgi:hypothetical protein
VYTDYRIVRAGVNALRAKEESKREAAVALLKRFSTRGDQSVVKGLRAQILAQQSLLVISGRANRCPDLSKSTRRAGKRLPE